jgi:hypothetical protein
MQNYLNSSFFAFSPQYFLPLRFLFPHYKLICDLRGETPKFGELLEYLQKNFVVTEAEIREYYGGQILCDQFVIGLELNWTEKKNIVN